MSSSFYRVSAPSRNFIEGFVPTYLHKQPVIDNSEAQAKLDRICINARSIAPEPNKQVGRKAFSTLTKYRKTA